MCYLFICSSLGFGLEDEISGLEKLESEFDVIFNSTDTSLITFCTSAIARAFAVCSSQL